MLELTDFIRTIHLINEGGTKYAAEKEFLTRKAVYDRIRRLEEVTGIQFYPGTYNRMTYLGREWLKQHDTN